jgi:hypothetical protein
VSAAANSLIRWRALPIDVREQLGGKLAGLWGAASDEAAFDALAIDKQQALLLIYRSLQSKGLWHLIKKIDNVYGEGGVGISFEAWPLIRSTLSRRKDFTTLFANHKDTTGGFYEKGRPDAVLHFLYQDGNPPKWYVHFDLHSPVHSLKSAAKHIRHEFLGKLTPDCKMIGECFKD